MLDIIDIVSSNVVWMAKVNRNLENDMKLLVCSDLINDLVIEMLGNFFF